MLLADITKALSQAWIIKVLVLGMLGKKIADEKPGHLLTLAGMLY